MRDSATDNPEYKTRILQKTEEIVQWIQSTEIFSRFQQAEDKLNRHPDAQVLLFAAKAKRNAYSRISLRYGYSHPASLKAKREYEEVLRQIAAIPLIEEYKNIQEELNDLLQGVARIIMNTLAPDVRAEIREDSAGGCGNGGCGGCSCRHH